MDENFAKVIEYMKSHWPSQVKPEWQVSLEEYPTVLKQVIADFTNNKTKNRHFIRIAGLSGSGKTTQLLPATEAYFESRNLNPVLVAARKFVEYHPHYQEILEFYGEENLRKMTDEFSTIMMFLTLKTLTAEGYDLILDVTLLDPEVETILLQFLEKGNYDKILLMIAASPEVTEKHLGARSWRHSRETELEFIRATKFAMEFYAKKCPKMRTILWNVFDTAPIYDGAIENSLDIFAKYSTLTEIPPHDESLLREAKISYLINLK